MNSEDIMNAKKNRIPIPPQFRHTRREAWRLLARIRQDQLDAAIAGHFAESAFYATEARVLREQLENQDALFISA